MSLHLSVVLGRQWIIYVYTHLNTIIPSLNIIYPYIQVTLCRPHESGSLGVIEDYTVTFILDRGAIYVSPYDSS